MIMYVGNVRGNFNTLFFGTHNGVFHCDETVGIAILEMAFMNMGSAVVRTRYPDDLANCNIVIDVGGGEFDHHMAGFDLCRKTGEKYASAGLVWERFGEDAIKNVISKENMVLDDDMIKHVKMQIDEEIMVPIDLEDNGEDVGQHTFSFITNFLPSYFGPQDYDAAFANVEVIVYDILVEIIRTKCVQAFAEKEINERLQNVDNHILEIPSQSMPWLEIVLTHNLFYPSNKVMFVIFPYPAGGWAAQCVPPTIRKKFKQLVPFPKNWAGKDAKTLPEASGIPDATFCHNGRFFVRAKTKEAVIEMCQATMNTKTARFKNLMNKIFGPIIIDTDLD